MNPYAKSRLPLDITSKEFFKFSHATAAAYSIAFIMENLYCTQHIFEAEDPVDAIFIGNHKFLSDGAYTKKVAKAEWSEEMNDFVAPFEEWFRYLVSINYPLEGAIREWCNQKFAMCRPENQEITKEKRSSKRIELEGMLKVLVEVFPFVSYKKCATFPSIQNIATELGLDESQVESIAKQVSTFPKLVGRPPDETIAKMKDALPHLKKWFDEVFPPKEKK